MSKVALINASNLHVGGGVQVAASFINEIPEKLRSGLRVLVSSEVLKNIELSNEEIKKFQKFEVFDLRGMRALPRIYTKDVSCVFTIFGPLYNVRTNFLSIVGFAQPWIIYPSNDCLDSMSFFEILKLKIKFFIQKLFFKKAHKIVVELEHVRNRIKDFVKYKREVFVVENCVSSVFFNKEKWLPLSRNYNSKKLKMGFVGRDYPHKNLKLLPQVVRILESDYGICSEVFLTLTEDEWMLKDEDFKKCCVNFGSLKVAQCPKFYEKMDVVVFPSLLECFSATPLEAMIMKKPLFVSDRSFNRDVCQNHAIYFDPLDPYDLASKIYEYFFFPGNIDSSIQEASDYAKRFSSAKTRCKKYLEIIQTSLM